MVEASQAGYLIRSWRAGASPLQVLLGAIAGKVDQLAAPRGCCQPQAERLGIAAFLSCASGPFAGAGLCRKQIA